MEPSLKPNLEIDTKLLHQKIDELTKANVALQNELAERQQTEVVLQSEIAQAYQELNKLRRAEQLARQQTAALVRTLQELTKNSTLNKFLGHVLTRVRPGCNAKKLGQVA